KVRPVSSPVGSVGRRGLLLGPALLACLAVLGWAPAARATTPYTPIAPALSTPWTAEVSPQSPLPEYPRPSLERTRWMSLNGQWQYEAATPGERAPIGRSLGQTILVPYPVQSPLSGIERGDGKGWYRRQFVAPAGWRKNHLIL